MCEFCGSDQGKTPWHPPPQHIHWYDIFQVYYLQIQNLPNILNMSVECDHRVLKHVPKQVKAVCSVLCLLAFYPKESCVSLPAISGPMQMSTTLFVCHLDCLLWLSKSFFSQLYFIQWVTGHHYFLCLNCDCHRCIQINWWDKWDRFLYWYLIEVELWDLVASFRWHTNHRFLNQVNMGLNQVFMVTWPSLYNPAECSATRSIPRVGDIRGHLWKMNLIQI